MFAKLLPSLALLVSVAAPAHAQLTLRRTELVEGAYVTVGNLLIDCPGAGTGACSNNTSMMIPVDVDTDPATTMSSAATLDLPPGAIVRSATLYVSGLGSDTTAAITGPPWIPTATAAFAVKLGVTGAPYVTIEPEGYQSISLGVGYLARFDVTSLVTSSGEYLVADALLSPATHSYNRIMSWTLFVTYEDGSPPFLVNLYDGALNCFQGSTVFPLTSFRTPSGMAPRALLTAWSTDGAAQFPGESITVGTLRVSNAQNPVNNIGNSSVTGVNGPIARRPSTFRVNEEMDLDTFDVSSAFMPSQSSVDVTFTCGTQEGVVYHLLALGVDVIVPRLELEKSVVDINGGTVVAGDELRYRLVAKNAGGDDAIDVVMRDPLPRGLSYVPESIEYSATTRTDATGDDEAEWTGSELVFRLGAAASATRGGTLAVGLEAVVTFRARVETTTAARTIVNQAFLTAVGAQGGAGATQIEARSSTVGVEAIPAVPASDAGVIADDAATVVASDAGAAAPDAAMVVSADAAAVVRPDAAPVEKAPDNGCGCATSTPASTGVWILVGLMAFVRRRRA